MSEDTRRYTAERAIHIARLWRAGKMIGADIDEVVYGLLRGVEQYEDRIKDLCTLLHHHECDDKGCSCHDFAAEGVPKP